MFNYKYITAGNKVIALSSYAGKTVRGVAKCAPGDVFNEEKGKDLATARCAYKIALKRQKRANRKYAEAVAEFARAEKFLAQMEAYVDRAEGEVDAARDALNYFSENI